MKNVLKIFLILVLIVPLKCFAKEYVDNGAKLKYSIDESVWTPEEMTQEREYIQNKWKSSTCGFLMFGSTDAWGEMSENDRAGATRSQINDSIIDEGFFEEYRNGLISSGLNVTNSSIKEFSMKYMQFEGIQEYNGIKMDYEIYYSFNNGYMFQWSYYGKKNATCSNYVLKAIETTMSTIDNNVSEKSNEIFVNFNVLIINIVATFFCYMIYPFISVIILKINYNKEECKKMSMYNSIIVAVILLIITIYIDPKSTWNILPAFLYYEINKNIWINKYNKKDSIESNKNKRKEEKNINESIEDDKKPKKEMVKAKSFKCSNCGAIVVTNSKECPNCGELFEGEDYEEDNVIDLDRLYSDAKKELNKNKSNAKNLFEKYIKNELKNIEKKYDKSVYSFNNVVEFTIFCKKEANNDILYINSNISNAYYYLGYINVDNKKYDEAQKALKDSLKWNPYNISSLFEQGEIYKINEDNKEFKQHIMKLYEKIYDVKDLAHYYRDLGYYYIENKDWNLAKALYLYSLKYEVSSNVKTELEYIIAKSGDESLPNKEDLASILRDNNIPTFISKDILNIIKELNEQIINNKQENTPVGKMIKELINRNSGNN